jgi:hypothetical protein
VNDTQNQIEDRLQWEAIIPEGNQTAGESGQSVRILLELRLRQEQGSAVETVIAF